MSGKRDVGRKASVVVSEEFSWLSARLAAMKVPGYGAYLKSAHWRAKRQRHRKKSCQVCGRKDRLHLHHVTYERLGREAGSDFMTLCWICHGRVHHLAAAGKGTLDPRVVVGPHGIIIEGRVKFAPVKVAKPKRRRRRRRRTP